MKNFLLGAMATTLCVVLLGANYQAAPKKYEYEIFESATDHRLNRYGKEGCRLIRQFSHSPPDESFKVFTFVMEREKP
jgi:hypothetical protein